MLKKIKKYKITIRPSFVLRNLKRKISLAQEVQEEPLQKRIDEEIARLQGIIVPSAIYETYSKNQTPEPLMPLWENAPKKALSLSLFVNSIGSHLEKDIESQSGEKDGLKAPITDSIARESLEQSANFVAKLLTEEALRLAGDSG